MILLHRLNSILIIWLLLSPGSMAQGDKPLLHSTPFLQNPADNSITVSWFTNELSMGWVEFGRDKDLGKVAENIRAGMLVANVKNHEVNLTDLEPGKKYYYRVAAKEMLLFKAYKRKYGETVYSEIYEFTLPDPKKSDFTAIIFNDLHRNKEVLKALMKEVKKIDYDFTMFNGDCLADAISQEAIIDFLSFSNEEVDAASKPIFHIRGNHETRGPYTYFINDLTDNTENKTFGSFSWGDTRFVLLDCGEDKPDAHKNIKDLARFDKLRAEEFEFLNKEIKTKAFKKASKRILLHHVPLYQDEYEQKIKRLERWEDLLNKCNFDVAINGHTHHFAFHDKNTMGNAYPVVIGGGKKESDATFMILQKQDKMLTLKVIGSNGTLLGEYNL